MRCETGAGPPSDESGLHNDRERPPPPPLPLVHLTASKHLNCVSGPEPPPTPPPACASPLTGNFDSQQPPPPPKTEARHGTTTVSLLFVLWRAQSSPPVCDGRKRHLGARLSRHDGVGVGNEDGVVGGEFPFRLTPPPPYLPRDPFARSHRCRRLFLSTLFSHLHRLFSPPPSFFFFFPCDTRRRKVNEFGKWRDARRCFSEPGKRGGGGGGEQTRRLLVCSCVRRSGVRLFADGRAPGFYLSC